MAFDPVLLSRLQFAFTITFHIIFPSFTIGLSAFIAVLLARHAITGRSQDLELARFWTKIFAISFAMGVVSGVVLSYQFGTNWSRFSTVAGNIIGPLMAYEVLTAFFLEATFLGIMLFGAGRVPGWLHLTASIMVAIGTAISAFWILAANSWMQFPVGHEMREGIAFPLDWLRIIFSPTFPLRFAHMVTAAYITTAFVVVAVGARFALAGRFPDHAKTMLRMGLGLAVVLVPLQILIGDMHGLKTAEYQPAKLAAIEGHWENEEEGAGVPLILFGWPNQKTETNDYALSLPHIGSLIVTHSWAGRFPSLKDFAPADRPPVPQVFFAFRFMVGIGFAMLGFVAWGVFLWWRGDLMRNRLFLRIAANVWPVGFLAIISGWMVTEIGRQPWVVTGFLRSADAASPLTMHTVLVSLALFVLVYGVVFSAGIYFINRLINAGPTPHVVGAETGLPSRPLSGAARSLSD
ncbi:cytochrome ubiquinol oxidase subunit I [Beijerinckia indica]|uniref:Cytochrome bd ubiquinol oxidase subunit I n=1 Tax=Beijerinckia indica subsp. indica (strain ATCC 9039 / DSM 1715 / NCIMB 8712) TaxID=395963 RepID=B2IDR5_BEII9|nr:cytochrome ubiquinol oxidase subunit I [Beijerinckia indica]ACB96847.1 cytochrome bd ubiquinol oxidase subunit I [Beijerinckia indica subsp. indica ATCC 9039]